MRLVNLTPHALAFFEPGVPDVVAAGAVPVLALPSSGIARVALDTRPDEPIEVEGVHLPVSRTGLRDVTGLPPAQAGVLLVVSLVTYQACPDRDDLVVVDRAVRDGEGRIVGARGLARPARQGR